MAERLRAMPQGGRARRLIGAFAVGFLLVGAAPAWAGQFVFERGASGVWAMNADGSGARKLVDLSQVPGMSEIDTASVRPDGTEVAFVAGWSGARHEEARWDPFALGYCGDGCLGYYELRNGALQRMTEGPAPCPGSQPCRITENDARVAVDGSVAFSYDASFASQQFPGGAWQESSAESEPRLRAAGGGAATKVVSPCAEPDMTLDRPAPNPTNPREVLYRGCLDPSNAYDALARSGADPGDPGDDVGIVDDSGSFVGYDWRPDGAQVAFTDTGCNPAATSCGPSGLQVADLGDPSQPATSVKYVLASPSGTTFYSPRYVGSDRIAFVANGDIWMVPTSCESGGCSFPGSAKRLTSFGDVGPAIGYTTSDATIPAVAQSPSPCVCCESGTGTASSLARASCMAPSPAAADLAVKGAWISHHRLHVRGSMARAADGGKLRITLHAAGRRARFAARIRHGRVRLDHRLRGPLRRARSGVVGYVYAGNARLLPVRAHLWAARRPAHLKRRKAVVRQGRLRVKGTISHHAHGKVLVLLAWTGAGGARRSWHGLARIHRGRWRLSKRLPAAARAGGALTVRYTGNRNVRGQQLAGTVVGA